MILPRGSENNFRIFAGAKSLSKWKKRGTGTQGRARLRLQQEPLLHIAGRWAEHVYLNAGRWSVWWWIDEGGLMASICLATKKYWGRGKSQEGHICHLTTCTETRAYAKILSYLCWLTQEFCFKTCRKRKYLLPFQQCSHLSPLLILSWTCWALIMLTTFSSDQQAFTKCSLGDRFVLGMAWWYWIGKIEEFTLQMSDKYTIDCSPEGKCFDKSSHEECLGHLEYQGLFLTRVSIPLPSFSSLIFPSHLNYPSL